MYVCVCNEVTDREVRKAVRRGAESLDALRNELGVASCCGRCVDCAVTVLNDELITLWAQERAVLAPI